MFWEGNQQKICISVSGPENPVTRIALPSVLSPTTTSASSFEFKFRNTSLPALVMVQILRLLCTLAVFASSAVPALAALDMFRTYATRRQ